MYLHEDKETFKEIIEQVSDDTGRTAIVIEKDYYVCLLYTSPSPRDTR